MAMFNMTVSPDFAPDRVAGWYIFNTWLQKQLGVTIHLELYSDFATQRIAIANGDVDLIFANPYDAAMLVRELGFFAVATPQGAQDEAIVVVAESSQIRSVEDLQPGIHVAMTSDPAVNLIGMILLEPGDLTDDKVQKLVVPSYAVVAKTLLQGKAEVGFLLKEAYDDLSQVIKKQLRELITSRIYVVRHVMLVGQRLLPYIQPLQMSLVGMKHNPKSMGVLDSLGLQGWELQTQEENEFMIDLMDTLSD